MTNKDTGGPAFPCEDLIERDINGHLIGMEISSTGLSIRDYFAAKVVSKCLEVCSTNARSAEEAYKIADAMMEARK